MEQMFRAFQATSLYSHSFSEECAIIFSIRKEVRGFIINENFFIYWEREHEHTFWKSESWSSHRLFNTSQWEILHWHSRWLPKVFCQSYLTGGIKDASRMKHHALTSNNFD